jgi:hypothetical protein
MFRKLAWGLLLAAFASLTVRAFAQDETAYLRVLQLANDGSTAAIALQDGSTILTNIAPGSVSDYLQFTANHSSIITLTISPARGPALRKEWAVPPLRPGYHTAALVGSSVDNTLQLVFIDEDTLCEGRLSSGSCVIVINNIRNSPALRLTANRTVIADDVEYRQAVVGSVPAGTYLNLVATDANTPQTILFQQQLQVFEPNVIYLYNLRGNYLGVPTADYTVGTVRRVPVDTMTFLRGLTAKLQLTDTKTLFATENIVAILEQSGFDRLLQNVQLPLTIFVPMDEALAGVSGDLYQCALRSPAAMRALILNHIVAGAYSPEQLGSAGQVSTVGGNNHRFRLTNNGVMIDNTVEARDSLYYPTANGSVYLIDQLLIPDGFVDQYCSQG